MIEACSRAAWVGNERVPDSPLAERACNDLFTDDRKQLVESIGPGVRQASCDEAAALAALLARAFAEEPIEQWCLACDDLFALIELEFAEAVAQLVVAGSLWVSEDLSGAAAWIPPGADYDDAAIDAVVGPVLAAHGGSPERRAAFWEWVEEHRPGTGHFYLDLVGVDPSRREAGIGTRLLTEGLPRVDEAGEPAFLITSDAGHAAWYARHGFLVRSDEDPPAGGPRVWFMERPSVTSRIWK